MNISEVFIRRPVATTLLTVAIGLAGAVAFRILPVSPLPQVDFPTISVQAGLPGASPETMASSVATPLERQFTRIASVTEMTSSSSLGSTSITLQFDLNRNIDAAARDVQAAINAARGYLPANLPNNPTYRKVNPADSPIVLLALTSPILTKAQMYDAASSIMAQKLAQISGVGQVIVGGSSLPTVRVELDPRGPNKDGIGLEQGTQERVGGAHRGLGPGRGLGGRHSQFGLCQRPPFRDGDHFPPAGRQHYRYGGPHPGRASGVEGVHSAIHRRAGGHGPNGHHSRFGA